MINVFTFRHQLMTSCQEWPLAHPEVLKLGLLSIALCHQLSYSSPIARAASETVRSTPKQPKTSVSDIIAVESRRCPVNTQHKNNQCAKTTERYQSKL